MNDLFRAIVQRRAWLVFALILVFAAFLRLDRLDELPPGLHYDEAFKGIAARWVIAGTERPIFFTENLTEEPMMAYATALSFVLFGDSPWSIRLVSALAGILTVGALYWVARALFRSTWIAALASFVLAILYWHLNFSRLGMEPILTPLMMTLAFAFLLPPLLRADQRRTDWILLALAGVFFAAVQYTYKAALFVPGLVGFFLLVETLMDRKFLARHWRGLAVFSLAAFLIFAPLGLYFVTHLDQFWERPGTVLATSSGVAPLADNVMRVAGMFFVQGDDNPRSNLPGRPALDPFLALGFVLGIATCVARWRQRESRFLLLWLVVMILPSVLTDFAPHFGRSIGVTPALALIIASGFATVVEKARHRVLLPTAYCLLMTGLAFSTFSTVNDYFNTWAARTGNFVSFDAGYLTLAQKLRARPEKLLYLSPVESAHYTIQFGLAERTAASFDGRQVLVVSDSPAAYGIVTSEDDQSLAHLQKIFPRGLVIDTVRDWTGKPYASVFQTVGAPLITPSKNVGAQLGDAIRLLGYDATRNGNEIGLTIFWNSVAATPNDYTVFVQLIGAPNPATQSPVWAQVDRRPGDGSYPTSRWRPGETVIDNYRFNIPADARGDYQIQVGMYNLKTGARLHLNDAPREQDYVVLERLTLP